MALAEKGTTCIGRGRMPRKITMSGLFELRTDSLVGAIESNLTAFNTKVDSFAIDQSAHFCAKQL